MAKEEKKAPKLRFNGYTNDWEQVKLEKIAAFSKGKDYSKLDLKRKGYPIFLYGQMYTDYRYKIVETSTYASLKKDAVVSNGNEIVIPSSGETSVDIARASWIAQKGIILGSDLNIIRPTSSVHPLFLALSLSNNQVKYNLAKVAQGNSIVHLYNNNLKKVNIYFPNIVEQNKIGNILNSISNCINLHERKCEELALIKKALLQKLFPKKDEVRPEVRYKNFSDAWEQRRLGEVADVRDGTHDSPKYINEGYPLLTSKNVGDGYINYDDVKYVSENDYVQINKRSKVDVNDILMGMIGTIGNLALIREEPDFAIKNVALIKHTSNFDYQFLFQELQTSAISKELLSGMDGGTQKFVSLKKIRNLSVMLPSENEQKKIGSYLMRFDSLIALHQRKLEKLKQLKKFLLQNMFI